MYSLKDKLVGMAHQNQPMFPGGYYGPEPSIPYEYADPWAEYSAQQEFPGFPPYPNQGYHNYPPQQPFWCDVCKINFMSQKQLNNHKSSKNHSRKVKALGATTSAYGNFLAGLEKKSLTCQLCQVSIGDTDSFQCHLKGFRHERNVHERSQKEQVEVNFCCEICDLEFGDHKSAFIAHLDGKSHAKRLELSTVCYEILDPGKIAYYCELCHLPHEDPGTYLEHLGSDRHKKRVRLQEEGYDLNPPGSGAIANPGFAEQKCFWCDICKVLTTGFQGYDDHIVSQKHQNKMNPASKKSEADEKTVSKSPQEEQKPEDNKSDSPVSEDEATKKSPREESDEMDNEQKNKEEKNELEVKNRQEVSETDFEPYRCDTCHVNMTSERIMDLHLNGHQHLKKEKLKLLIEKKKSEELESDTKSLAYKMLSSGPQVLEGEIYCPLCDLKIMRVSQAEEHFISPKHKNKMKNLIEEHQKTETKAEEKEEEEIPSTTDDDQNPPRENTNIEKPSEHQFICDICLVSSCTEDQYEIHLGSPKHLKTVIKAAEHAGNHFLSQTEADELEKAGRHSYYDYYLETYQIYKHDSDFRRGFAKVRKMFKRENRKRKRNGNRNGNGNDYFQNEFYDERYFMEGPPNYPPYPYEQEGFPPFMPARPMRGNRKGNTNSFRKGYGNNSNGGAKRQKKKNQKVKSGPVKDQDGEAIEYVVETEMDWNQFQDPSRTTGSRLQTYSSVKSPPESNSDAISESNPDNMETPVNIEHTVDAPDKIEHTMYNPDNTENVMDIQNNIEHPVDTPPSVDHWKDESSTVMRTETFPDSEDQDTNYLLKNNESPSQCKLMNTVENDGDDKMDEASK